LSNEEGVITDKACAECFLSRSHGQIIDLQQVSSTCFYWLSANT